MIWQITPIGSADSSHLSSGTALMVCSVAILKFHIMVINQNHPKSTSKWFYNCALDLLRARLGELDWERVLEGDWERPVPGPGQKVLYHILGSFGVTSHTEMMLTVGRQALELDHGLKILGESGCQSTVHVKNVRTDSLL